jgi:indolepyruvate ferredoxin oxidoreductase
VLLAFDVLVASSDAHVAGASPDRTRVVASSSAVGTGSMVVHPDTAFPQHEAIARLQASARSVATIDALANTTAALGDAAMANVYLLGVAVQQGVIPVDPSRVEEAIALNGVAVDKNIAAFRAGRPSSPPRHLPHSTRWSRRGRAELVAYQDEAYAARYRAVGRAGAPPRGGGHLDVDRVGRDGRSTAVQADGLQGRVRGRPARPRPRVRRAAAAQLWGRRGIPDPAAPAGPARSGDAAQDRARAEGQRLLRPLVALRRLRGTAWDPFGRSEIRRVERELIGEYLDVVEELVAALTPVNHAQAVRVAGLPDGVRGYEQIKLRAVAAYRLQMQRELAAFRDVSRPATAPPSV